MASETKALREARLRRVPGKGRDGMTWTRFMDMHSGGGQKLDWPYIYIEAPEQEARAVFYAKFGRNPDRVTCTCCGQDYSVGEADSLEQATAFERDCQFIEDERGWLFGKNRPADYRKGRYIEPGEPVPDGYRLSSMSQWRTNPRTLAEYLAEGAVKVVRAEEITDAERRSRVPDEGYIWAGDDAD